MSEPTQPQTGAPGSARPGGSAEAIEELGGDFEVIEEHPAPLAAGTPPAAGIPAAAPAAAVPQAPVPAGGIGPIRSSNAWRSLGLGLAIAGLLSNWEQAGADFLGGGLLAWSLWELLCHGLGAVWRPLPARTPYLPAALALYGLLRLVLLGGFAPLGWAESTVTGAFGAVFALLGGALAAAAPRLGKSKDAALPAGETAAGASADRQFSHSLLAYLMILVGLLMPWCSSGQRGADSAFGVITLACVLLALWASWVGAWRLWSRSLVTAKLGALLFLAPTEAFALATLGLLRHVLRPGDGGFGDFLSQAWPPASGLSSEPFLPYRSGALLTMAGAGLALYVLLHGTRAAMEITKQRKALEAEARKSAREARKGDRRSP